MAANKKQRSAQGKHSPKSGAARQSLAQIVEQAVAAYRQGDLAEAERLCQVALEAKPDYFDALRILGIIALRTRRMQAAVDYLSKAVAINRGNAAAYSNLGTAQLELKDYESALASYECALKLDPDDEIAHYNRGNALRYLKRYEAALDSYDHALKINPGNVEFVLNRGNALRDLQRYEEALASYRSVLMSIPDYAEVHGNCAAVLLGLKRWEEALGSCERALALKPEYAEAHLNRGSILRDLKRYEEALASYERALAINPEYAEAHFNRGNILYELEHHDAALACNERAIALDPDFQSLHGSWLHAKMRVCDWTGLSDAVRSLIDKISSGKGASEPFPVLALSDSLSLQRQAAEIWVKNQGLVSVALPRQTKRAPSSKIRLGYYSADFHNHATAYLMAELFERHDRSQFELIAFSFGPNVNDEMRGRVQAAFDRFIDVSKEPDKEVASLSRSLGVDIAVDLKGYTTDSRPGIFAHRAAPIQVNYLGYPGTMGAEYIDYLIADRTLIPEEARQHYSEKIAYLPHSYQVNDGKRRISERVFTREEAGLPETGFVFCCFNNNYKITPETFDGWMRLLKRVAGSVLWLLEDNPTAARNLRQEAQARGVDADRLVFAGRLPLDEHLARHRLADLFLDTLPCNAHTTASDALWAGLPVLTCTGEIFASRVAASLLNAIGLPELITTSQEAYEALGIALATDTERLSAIRQRLSANRLTAPLFDTARFTRYIEDAYQQMVERYQADLPPEHLYVPA